jgi:hypothetical protein
VRCLVSEDHRSIAPIVFSGIKRSPLVQELKIECEIGKMPFRLEGGAEFGKLLMIEEVLYAGLSDQLHSGDVLLSANRL